MPLSRMEADELVAALEEWLDERRFRRDCKRWDSREAMDKQFHAMNAARERLIDRLCGEEHTDALPGRTK